MRNKEVALIWTIWAIAVTLLIVPLFSLFNSDVELSNEVNTLGALLLLPLIVIFRSNSYLALLKQGGKNSCPPAIRLLSLAVSIYALAACSLFAIRALQVEPAASFAGLLLAPFGAFSFYMGRWALYRI